jgi:hypothetical protein
MYRTPLAGAKQNDVVELQACLQEQTRNRHSQISRAIPSNREVLEVARFLYDQADLTRSKRRRLEKDEGIRNGEEEKENKEVVKEKVEEQEGR